MPPIIGGGNGVPTGVRPKAPGRRAWISLPSAYLYFLWGMVILEPHRWIAERGLRITAMNGALSILAIPLIPMILARLPVVIGRRRKPTIYWPLLGFLLVTLSTVRTAIYPDLAWNAVKIFIIYFLMSVATFIYIRSARQVVPLLVLYAGQYLWWGWHSGTTGAVWWHPTLANSDAFGPLVLMGFSICLSFAFASRSRMFRYVGFFLATYCALGIVTAFARGVALSSVVVAALLWVRSPFKGRMALWIVLGGITVVAASAILYPNNAFWNEINSSFTEGTEEGTGNDRWELWKVGMAVFKEHPILGVGAEHAGHYGFRLVMDRKIEVGGVYSWLPTALQGRQLHSVYVQMLAEHGALGMFFFLIMVVDFWRRNARLRLPEFVASWARQTGGKYDLRWIAVGLEGAMVAYLATGIFYAQLYMHWFFSLVLLNILVHSMALPNRRSLLVARPVRGA